MRVKRYVVETMPDALKKIRQELGNDAVILNTKEIRVGGFLGLFGKKRIEVFAAMETNHVPVAAASHTEHKAPVTPGKAINSPVNVDPAVVPVMPAKVVAAAYHPIKPSLPKDELTAPPIKATNEVLLEEMKQMRELVNKLTKWHDQPSSLPPFFEKFAQRLGLHDFDPVLIEMIMHNAAEGLQDSTHEATEAYVGQLFKEQLMAIIATDKEKGISPGTRIIHLVGPTGVGKTTTIAKLAAEQVLKNNRKVGLITSDTYRISAVEQLKTYATILNVPLEVVFSPQDITKALGHLMDRDIIFMDTAGRNYRNEMYVSELNSLLQNKDDSETYLVLSLTTNYKDIRVITKNFAKFKLDKVLFTKLDETASYGTIFNLAYEFGLKPGYLTNGQNVPDDINVINEHYIIDRILEGEVLDE